MVEMIADTKYFINNFFLGAMLVQNQLCDCTPGHVDRRLSVRCLADLPPLRECLTEQKPQHFPPRRSIVANGQGGVDELWCGCAVCCVVMLFARSLFLSVRIAACGGREREFVPY